MKETLEKQNKKLTTLEKTKTQTTQIKDNTQYPRVLNQSDIYFTDDEMQLLRKGMKYNLQQKPKNWIETLAIEAETAISQLDFTIQNYYRHSVAINLSKLIKTKTQIVIQGTDVNGI
jgi:2-succinyl-5-enolpyruvyl-6-hydroxy-3-cyclohexene-1-carboxylate synthase